MISWSSAPTPPPLASAARASSRMTSQAKRAPIWLSGADPAPSETMPKSVDAPAR